MINNRNLFLTVLKAGSPRSGCWHGWVLVRTLHVSDCQLLTVSFCSENRGRELSGIFIVDVSDSLATPQTAARQAPLSMRFLNTELSCHFLLQGSSWLRDQTCVSCIAGRFLSDWATSEALWKVWMMSKIRSHMFSKSLPQSPAFIGAEIC